MTTARRRGLQIDDPLGERQLAQRGEPPPEAGAAAASEAAANRPVQASDPISEDRQRTEPEGAGRQETVAPRQSGARAQQAASREMWRAWSGITGVGSFRLPHELLVELGDTARDLGLPIGMIVTAAITQLLDQPPEQIAALVDRADDARIHGRRNARRRLTERTGG
ncbi:MAG: hypothetical protein ACXVS6_22760 [Solirubrobacteraceae bacterium]